MSKIAKLDQHVANLIAAGEVIERVNSVVKELVENAIDASSSIIEINLIDSGFKEIKVIDNGNGMEEEDIKYCVLPHYTSKISTESDLFSIHTLGFRGEALPSIASVSDLTICSSLQGSSANLAIFKDGKLESISKTARDKGTTVTVNNLFFNTPARLQNMNNQVSEVSVVADYINKLSLAYPSISFKLTNNDKVLYQSNGSGNMLEVISNIYGVGVASEMIEFACANNYFKVEGFTSKLSVLRSTKNHITILVNGRVIRNYQLSNAIIGAYNGRIMIGKYPITILNITCDYSLVDVNVHPAKTEVRFSMEKSLKDLIYQKIIDVLNDTDLTVVGSIEKQENVLKESHSFDPFDLFNDNVKPSTPKEILVEELKQIKEEVSKDDYTIQKFEIGDDELVLGDNNSSKLFNLNYIGQLFDTYLLCSEKDEFYLIDQHAAEERVNYERIYDFVANKEVKTIDLIVPFNFTFPVNEAIVLKEKQEDLLNLGIEIEEFGNNTFVVRKIGTWIPTRFAKEYLEEVFTSFIRDTKSKKEEFLNSLAKSIACKASIKANEYHSREEALELIEMLSRCKNPYTCPHGRPTIIKYTKYDIEKWFKRIV